MYSTEFVKSRYNDTWKYIYVMVLWYKDKDEFACKIGMSLDPNNRQVSLSYQIGLKQSDVFFLAASIATPDADIVEKMIHKDLEYCALDANEWFDITPEKAITAVFETINKYTSVNSDPDKIFGNV